MMDAATAQFTAILADSKGKYTKCICYFKREAESLVINRKVQREYL